MIKHLKSEDFRKLLWKNGRGSTQEIAISPLGADFLESQFEWRLSSAKIESNGEFSRFPAHDRILMVLNGNGLALKNLTSDQAPVLNCLDSYHFSGRDRIEAKITQGEVEDLNLFFQRGLFSGEMKARTLGKDEQFEWCPLGAASLLFVARGEVALSARSAPSPTYALAERHSLLWTPISTVQGESLATETRECRSALAGNAFTVLGGCESILITVEILPLAAR